jgi:hypothetical protein
MKITILLLTFFVVASSPSMAGEFKIGPYCHADSADPYLCVKDLLEDWTCRDGMVFYEAGSALSRTFCAHPKLVLEALIAVPPDLEVWIERMPTHTFFIMEHPQSEFGISAAAHLQELRSCMLEQAEALIDDEQVGAAARALLDTLKETEIRYVDQT